MRTVVHAHSKHGVSLWKLRALVSDIFFLLLGLYDDSKSAYHLYGHVRHLALVMSKETPPSRYSNHLFVRSSQSDTRAAQKISKGYFLL